MHACLCSSKNSVERRARSPGGVHKFRSGLQGQLLDRERPAPAACFDRGDTRQPQPLQSCHASALEICSLSLARRKQCLLQPLPEPARPHQDLNMSWHHCSIALSEDMPAALITEAAQRQLTQLWGATFPAPLQCKCRLVYRSQKGTGVSDNLF